MPKKFGRDAKYRVVCLVEDRILPENLSMRKHVRQLMQQVGRDGYTREHLVAEVAKLSRVNQELRDTNELLRATPAFRIGTRPEASKMIWFIDELRDRFSIEFTCETLNTRRTGGFVTPWLSPVPASWT